MKECLGDDPTFWVIVLILLTPVGLGCIYYGLKAVISRKATVDEKDDYTGRCAVLIGTFWVVLGTSILAVLTPSMLCLYHVWQSSQQLGPAPDLLK